MKYLTYPAFLIGLFVIIAWLSQAHTKASVDTLDQRDYVVTFASVKISDETLRQTGFPSVEDINKSLETRAKFARYVSEHPEQFSFTPNRGNALPIARTSETTRLHFVLDAQKEQQDFATYGMSLTQFDPSMSIQGEDRDGTISCSWGYNYGVTLREPVGNSTGVGGCGFSGFILRAHQPDLTLLFRTKNASLWEFVELDHH